MLWTILVKYSNNGEVFTNQTDNLVIIKIRKLILTYTCLIPYIMHINDYSTFVKLWFIQNTNCVLSYLFYYNSTFILFIDKWFNPEKLPPKGKLYIMLFVLTL